MPLLSSSSFAPPLGLANGHLQTILPVLLRHVPVITQSRERIETPDGDFLDLDWRRESGSDRLVIITHGLEGSSANASVQGMASIFHHAQWDVLAWNLRGCSGESNRLLHTYHSGAWKDLACIIDHAARGYRRVALIGFSIGGNLTLNYLGHLGTAVDPCITGAVAFSVPCDLASSAKALESPINRIYMDHFMQQLRRKIRKKAEEFPEALSTEGLDSMRSFREFDGRYTAPMNGFLSAEDYWRRSSSKPVLQNITIPTLLVNAINDPFLGTDCFPWQQATLSPHLYLETPASGGHLGFFSFSKIYWSEHRALDFLNRP